MKEDFENQRARPGQSLMLIALLIGVLVVLVVVLQAFGLDSSSTPWVPLLGFGVVALVFVLFFLPRNSRLNAARSSAYQTVAQQQRGAYVPSGETRVRGVSDGWTWQIRNYTNDYHVYDLWVDARLNGNATALSGMLYAAASGPRLPRVRLSTADFDTQARLNAIAGVASHLRTMPAGSRVVFDLKPGSAGRISVQFPARNFLDAVSMSAALTWLLTLADTLRAADVCQP
jgi:hypothetical protein